METITTTEALAAFCARAMAAPYVTIDTAFLRERTYWSKLCLVQLALPAEDGTTDGPAAIVDPIAGEGMSLAPLYALLAHPGTVKVFHAARQDIEIFFVEGGVMPAPLFDTQVAAMVCGFGEQAAYETLVRRIAKANLDKTSRFTDWSRRPLTGAQLDYALADVTHLRVIYEYLSARLGSTGRGGWVADELAVLAHPATYRTDPDEAWLRIRTRSGAPRFLATVRELAKFREAYAQARNIPRTRVIKDDALLEVASLKPATLDDLSRARLLLREARRGEVAEGLLAAVRIAQTLPPEALPKGEDPDRDTAQVNPALADLLRVLLKARSDESGVAARLIASAADLDAIAAGRRDVAALAGWRAEVFGADALRLCKGEVGLAARGQSVRVFAVPAPA